MRKLVNDKELSEFKHFDIATPKNEWISFLVFIQKWTKMALTSKMKIPKNATFVLSSICLYIFLEDDYYLQLSILGETHNLKILPKNETL